MSRDNFYRITLFERIDFSDTLAQFKFRPEVKLNFSAGQCVTLAVNDGNKLVQRPYSILSSPYDPFLEFFVELVPQGKLTPILWELKVGDSILIRKAITGRFVLAEDINLTRHLMIATVTGIAPYISIVRTIQAQLRQGKGILTPHKLVILHGASYAQEFGSYKDELSEIAQDGWLNYIPTISRPWADKDWQGEIGRVEDLIRKYADLAGFNYNTAFAYVCGHPKMIDNAKEILTRAGFPKEQLKEEKYFLANRAYAV